MMHVLTKTDIICPTCNDPVYLGPFAREDCGDGYLAACECANVLGETHAEAVMHWKDFTNYTEATNELR